MSDVLISNFFLTPNNPDENTAAISDLKFPYPPQLASKILYFIFFSKK